MVEHRYLERWHEGIQPGSVLHRWWLDAIQDPQVMVASWLDLRIAWRDAVEPIRQNLDQLLDRMETWLSRRGQ